MKDSSKEEFVAGFAGSMYGVPGMWVILMGGWSIGLAYVGVGLILRYCVLRALRRKGS